MTQNLAFESVSKGANTHLQPF